MCSAIERLLDDHGQSTVEAALAIPILMALLLMMLQPGIVLYDKIIMDHAAAEGCRLLATTTAQNAATNEDYIRRRLSAVPEADIFHVHEAGCSWQIELTGDESSSETRVVIQTELKPLPILDMGLRSLGSLNDGGNLEIRAEASMATQPGWVQSSTNGAPRSDICGNEGE